MQRFWNRPDWRRIKDSVRRKWRKYLATNRLSMQAVCEESHGSDVRDYHEIDDLDLKAVRVDGPNLVFPCKRCGKEFTV